MTITAEATSRTVQTKKWKLHYNEAGSGHAIIMLHGTGPGATGWSNFSPNIGPLAEKYRVILLDCPGWGGSDPQDATKEPRGPTNALAVKLLMDELGIDKAALVGNSMGGHATMHFAVTYPERISHIITMGAHGSGPAIFSPAGFSEGMQVVRQTYEKPTPENFRRLVSVMVYDSSFVTDELCQQRSSAALANPTHLENWLKPFKTPGGGMAAMLAETYELTHRLHSVKTPALIFHGRDDRTVAVEVSMRYATILQNSRTVIFNRCGHWAQLEHAKEFNAMVDNFISLHS
jgi:2-hydroxy-6-oxonona-2,4-dienedioate hydrolase